MTKLNIIKLSILYSITINLIEKPKKGGRPPIESKVNQKVSLLIINSSFIIVWLM